MRAVEENWTLTNKTTSTFNNFEQRTYDFNSLEKKLLGWENSDD
jgi:plasmid replication initiation protein